MHMHVESPTRDVGELDGWLHLTDLWDLWD